MVLLIYIPGPVFSSLAFSDPGILASPKRDTSPLHEPHSCSGYFLLSFILITRILMF